MIEVFIFSLVMILLALAGLIWDITSGLLGSGVDGLLLLLVCLLVGGIFSLQLLMLARQRGLLGARRGSIGPSRGAGK